MILPDADKAMFANIEKDIIKFKYFRKSILIHLEKPPNT